MASAKTEKKAAPDPETSFREFGRKVIEERLAKLLSYVNRVRRGNDPDALHDMRVASRRLRAALSVFREAFDIPAYSTLTKSVRNVTSALRKARDLDVMIDGLRQDMAHLPPPRRGLAENVIRKWTDQRRRAQKDVVEALDALVAMRPRELFTSIADYAMGTLPTEGSEEAQDGAARLSETFRLFGQDANGNGSSSDEP